MHRRTLPALAAAAVLFTHGVAEAGYVQTNLVSSRPSDGALITDPEFINAWGVALRPAGRGGHWWVANTDTGRVTLYVGDSPSVPFGQDELAVTPVPGAGGAPAAPTGQVWNASGGFRVSGTSFTDAPITNVPARFITVSEDGTIAGWGEAGATLATRMRSFALAVDNSARVEAGIAPIYKGVAIDDGAAPRLYVANFSQNRVEIYDGDWQPVDAPSAFRPDPSQVPADYAPFNVQRVFNPARGADSLFVAYAKVNDAAAGEEATGAGLGLLVEYDLAGNLLAVWKDAGGLNAPWGIAAAPLEGFGPLSGTLLVGNFGDGTIAAFDFATQELIDHLRGPDGAPLSVDGLWDLKVGNGESLGRSDALYVSAGPEEETQGLFARLTWVDVPEPASALLFGLGLAGLAAFRRRR